MNSFIQCIEKLVFHRYTTGTKRSFCNIIEWLNNKTLKYMSMNKGWFRKTFEEYNKRNTGIIEKPKVNIINKNPNSIRFGKKDNKINNYGKEN